MIGQMSANHTAAQRAHVFLRQLLDIVERTLSQHDRRPGGLIPPMLNGHPASAAEGMSSLAGLQGRPPKEFMQLWDSTENLTTSLGSHLEFYSSLGSGMWSWGASNDRT
jgi:salicylate hydroxylase